MKCQYCIPPTGNGPPARFLEAPRPSTAATGSLPDQEVRRSAAAGGRLPQPPAPRGSAGVQLTGAGERSGTASSSRRRRHCATRGGRGGAPARIAMMVAALAHVSLIPGCSVPRPEPAVGVPGCALTRIPLTVDLAGEEAAAAEVHVNPLPGLLYNAAEDRLTSRMAADDGGGAPLVSHLVLSGGGQHGSFGTGFLAGLSPLPNYDVVTGVSTGALQAPLVILGNQPPPGDRRFDPRDDFPADANRPGRRNIDDLVSAYTITREETLYRSQGVSGVIRRATFGNLEPLRRRVGTLITDQTLRRLAALDQRKRLFILLLNWDTGDAEQVDMLDLARRYARGDTHARDCFIDVMIAASSEPLGAPPVLIDNHLYVDAGLRFGVFASHASRGGAEAAERLRQLIDRLAVRHSGPLVRTDMIRNGDIVVRRHAPPRYSALDVMGRGRSILVNQVYAFSMRDVLDRAGNGHQVRFAYITKNEMEAAPPASGVEFDANYMNRMIAVGRGRGSQGAWNNIRPD